MFDEIISRDDIYLQDIICSVVAENPTADETILYNKICMMVEIPSIETVGKILELIKLNRVALSG